MPAEQGLRVDHSEGLSPVEPAREPDQGDPGRVGGTFGFDVTLLSEGKLFAQKEMVRREEGRSRCQSSADCWGSASIKSTSAPLPAKRVAKLVTTVVLPVPPFRLT